MLEIIQTALLVVICFYLVQMNTKRQIKSNKQMLILDTCALIDARIVDVARAGFTAPNLVVPRFVVQELQLLADGNDAHKRERARFGLDIVTELQNLPQIQLVMNEDDFPEISKTDEKLVKLALKLSADLCTTDYNLNKVATIDGVRVLNVNELANAVRPVVLPGEKRQVKLVQRGSSKDQGVGYLEDGTMVVVAGAGNMIGKTLSVEVTRMLQSDAGKMIFAKAAAQKSKSRRPTKPKA